MICGVGEQGDEVGRAVALAGMRTQLLQVGGEHRVGAELRLDAHRGGEVGGAQQRPQVVQGEHQHAEHAVGAVDEGQALLLGERDRRETGGRQRLGGGLQPAGGVAHLALAHDRERAVRERGEIARAAERPVLAHHRGDRVVEQVGVGVRGLPPHARPSGRERGQAQQHQRAHDLGLDLGAGARRVRADQARLQAGAQFGGDVPVGQRAEPGRDAVVRLGVVGQRLDDVAAALDRLAGVVVDLDPGAVPGDGDDVLRVRAGLLRR